MRLTLAQSSIFFFSEYKVIKSLISSQTSGIIVTDVYLLLIGFGVFMF